MSELIKYNKKLTQRARILRAGQTDCECIVWDNILLKKQTGYKFTRQKPIGNFIADFYCSKLKLAIEIDGNSHYDKKEYDEEREIEFSKQGIYTFRLSNDAVYRNLDSVKENVLNIVNKLSN